MQAGRLSAEDVNMGGTMPEAIHRRQRHAVRTPAPLPNDAASKPGGNRDWRLTVKPISVSPTVTSSAPPAVVQPEAAPPMSPQA